MSISLPTLPSQNLAHAHSEMVAAPRNLYIPRLFKVSIGTIMLFSIFQKSLKIIADLFE